MQVIVCVLLLRLLSSFSPFFFFNDTATTEIYTLSLHDALPISRVIAQRRPTALRTRCMTCSAISFARLAPLVRTLLDRKSTRLNSSHSQISYAVFCLKKKKNNKPQRKKNYSTTLSALTNI